MKTVSLKMPEALDSQLEKVARRMRRSKSLIVRLALAEYLPRHAEPSKSSFLALALDLAGSVRGHSDLSTNKRRLDGYGR